MESRLSSLDTVERSEHTGGGGRQADAPRRRGFGRVRPRPAPRADKGAGLLALGGPSVVGKFRCYSEPRASWPRTIGNGFVVFENLSICRLFSWFDM